jgi:hypothetical protein
MNGEQYLIAKLADIMSGTDRSLEASIAVGCALRNRVQQVGDWWAVMRDHPSETPEDIRDPKFLKVLWKAEEIFYNRQADNTEGANAWHVRPFTDNYLKVDDLYFESFNSDPGKLF